MNCFAQMLMAESQYKKDELSEMLDPPLTDEAKIAALVDAGFCTDRAEAYWFLVDAGEYEGDGTFLDVIV